MTRAFFVDVSICWIFCRYAPLVMTSNGYTVVPTKSNSDVILCLQLPSQTLMSKLHLNQLKLIDHLCFNPILWIGLIHK